MEFFKIVLQQDGQQPLLDFLIGVPDQPTPIKKISTNKSSPSKLISKPSSQTNNTPKTTPSKAQKISSNGKEEKGKDVKEIEKKDHKGREKITKKDEIQKKNWAAIIGTRTPSKYEIIQILHYVISILISENNNLEHARSLISFNDIGIKFMRETGLRSGGFLGLGYP